MVSKFLKNTFVGGEIGSKMQNRFDFAQYQNSAKWIENFSVTKEGNLNFRNGTFYIDTVSDLSDYTDDTRPIKLFQWVRSDKLIFLLSFRYNTTDSKVYIDIYQDFSLIQTIETLYMIDNIKNIQMDNSGNYMYIIDGVRPPNRLVYVSDGTFTYDEVMFDTAPPYELENLSTNEIKASATTGTITLTSIDAIFDSSTNLYVGRYIKFRDPTGGTTGYCRITVELTSTTATAEVVSTIPSYNLSFSLFFSFSVIPASVSFYQGRLWYGSDNKIVGSRTQTDEGVLRFDDFTIGTDDDNALNLTNTLFKTPILWMKSTNRDFLAGSSTTIFQVSSSSDDGYLTPTNLPDITPITNEGSKNIVPLQENNNIFYVSTIGTLNDEGSRISSIKYDLLSEGYNIINTNTFNDEINKEGVIQCAYIKGYDDILYSLKNNGEISGLIYNPDQQINGWFRFTIDNWNRQKGDESDTTIESITTLRQTDGSELLVLAVKRKANGVYIRTIEYLSQPYVSVDEMEFYTGDETYDYNEYLYYLFQSQLNNNYVDCAQVYDGLIEEACTLSSLDLGENTFTCLTHSFVAGDVDREIHQYYGYELEEGVCKIVEYISEHVVKVNTLIAFSDTSLDEFVLTTNELTLGSIFYDKEVATIVDGGKGQEYTVASDGKLTLQYQGSYIIIGFKYIGLVKTLNLNIPTQDNNTSDLYKQIKSSDIYFYNTVGCKVGSSLYNTSQLFIGPSEITGKIPVVFNGIKNFTIQDEPKREKYLYFLKDDYSSCNIQLVNINLNFR